MKRWACVVLYSSLIAVAACGGGSNTTETKAPPPAAAPPPPPPPPCTAPPGAATGLKVMSINGGNVELSWTPAPGGPTSYVMEAGTAPGKSDASRIDLHSPASAYIATGVKPGTYYARVVAINNCGSAGPSNEVVATVR